MVSRMAQIYSTLTNIKTYRLNQPSDWLSDNLIICCPGVKKLYKNPPSMQSLPHISGIQLLCDSTGHRYSHVQ